LSSVLCGRRGSSDHQAYVPQGIWRMHTNKNQWGMATTKQQTQNTN